MNTNPLSNKVGIIGGGQLGKMMINAASTLGIHTTVLDPSSECPACYLSTDFIKAGFHDSKALEDLASKTDILTCEFEHISTDSLASLENSGYTVYPKAESLRIIQNKYEQKVFLKDNDIPLGPFSKIENMNDMMIAGDTYGYPFMLKSATGAYDGKGNFLVESESSLLEAYRSLGGDNNFLYAEKFVNFKKEISVLTCRSTNGEIKVYPICENIHKDSILYETSVPANITEDQSKEAAKLGMRICELFDGAGILCVEMFVDEFGNVLINEVAPRPHNSGHYTIEACVTSQFENHIRAILGLPLGSTKLLTPVVMRNLLGSDNHSGKPLILGIEDALKIEGLSLHIYGKSETKPFRKMGHYTVVSNSLSDARKNADKAESFLKIVSQNQ
ncbi:5-(carboxyamino)imidazole ribonucleotide synthase [Alkalibacter mobilis]|uniref:5-(carboxyamino)imidazole ribonucleotide synthase n=1 Tax=Alkalibacter mobilis TaxID=2787712 RepID=UPI0018A02602|nr:5-(carboxyamino)imidazole ribonucleotide synthase [Alkalibacter mobilis]MBF7097699.1 5-(carboxyamino)imidazole ribonucleotide synthase [Alkalibacter mobilis]